MSVLPVPPGKSAAAAHAPTPTPTNGLAGKIDLFLDSVAKRGNLNQQGVEWVHDCIKKIEELEPQNPLRDKIAALQAVLFLNPIHVKKNEAAVNTTLSPERLAKSVQLKQKCDDYLRKIQAHKEEGPLENRDVIGANALLAEIRRMPASPNLQNAEKSLVDAICIAYFDHLPQGERNHVVIDRMTHSQAERGVFLLGEIARVRGSVEDGDLLEKTRNSLQAILVGYVINKAQSEDPIEQMDVRFIAFGILRFIRERPDLAERVRRAVEPLKDSIVAYVQERSKALGFMEPLDQSTKPANKLLLSYEANQLPEAVALLALLRRLGSKDTKSLELQIEAFINRCVGSMQKHFSLTSESKHRPVGIVNKGNTCYAASWMSLVAMHPSLSKIYDASLPEEHPARAVLKKYHEAQAMANLPQKEDRTLVQNIRQLTEWFSPGGGQQDVSDFVGHIHREIQMPRDGTIGGVKVGVKIRQTTYDRTRDVSESSFVTQSPGMEYSFPIESLTVDSKDQNPKLSNMINSSLVSERDGSCTVSTLEEVSSLSIYHLNRQDSFQVSSDREVNIPLYRVNRSASGSGCTETLFGFVRYMGTGQEGHYVSYVQQGGDFYQMNDNEITPITAAEYLLESRHASTLLYSEVKRR